MIGSGDYYVSEMGVGEQEATTVAYDMYGDSDSNSDFEIDFQSKKNEIREQIDDYANTNEGKKKGKGKKGKNDGDSDSDSDGGRGGMYVCVCMDAWMHGS